MGADRSFPADAIVAPASERKFGGAPLAKVTATGIFEGYASLFSVVDLGRDLVQPGAFRDSLARRPPPSIKLLWQHDPAQPIGRWSDVREDAIGLYVRGELDLSLTKAREVHGLMRSGSVDGLSIGFRTERAHTDPSTGVRWLGRLDLWEVSIVTFPMLPGARVQTVKMRRPAPEQRALAHLIRQSAVALAAPLPLKPERMLP